MPWKTQHDSSVHLSKFILVHFSLLQNISSTWAPSKFLEYAKLYINSEPLSFLFLCIEHISPGFLPDCLLFNFYLTPEKHVCATPSTVSHFGATGWLSGWASAFGSGHDPGVLGSSPASGSLQGTRFSLSLCLCLSLCVSHEWIKSLKRKKIVLSLMLIIPLI